MKNRYNKLIGIIITVALLLTAVTLIAACGPKNVLSLPLLGTAASLGPCPATGMPAEFSPEAQSQALTHPQHLVMKAEHS